MRYAFLIGRSKTYARRSRAPQEQEEEPRRPASNLRNGTGMSNMFQRNWHTLFLVESILSAARLLECERIGLGGNCKKHIYCRIAPSRQPIKPRKMSICDVYCLKVE